MARTAVLAAGGIVLRRQPAPRFAVVRLRKRNEWVLPKGKLDDGETPRAAAEREVMEETGHAVSVHEFLGTLVYETNGRSKVVHYWRMEAGGAPVRELMHDIREVDWLPLDRAVKRLSRNHERTFLENVGPIALQAAHGAAEAGSSADVALEPRDIVTEGDDVESPRRSLLQRILDWLWRAA
jgi:8-oxo-dGTP diphosphatase